MDDLDHSIHIAEDDWTSFYEESEECSLQQPSLACLDDASLTDSEDSGNLSSAVSQSQQDSQQNPDNDKDGDTSNTAECTEEQSSNLSVPLNQPEDAATKSEEDSEVYPKCPAPVPEETGYSATNTLQTELLNKSEHLTKDGEVQPESEPLSCHQTGLNVNEPDTTERAVKEDVRSVSARAEKERWFVTVNDNPARWRARPTSVKKKQRQKKPFERRHACNTTQENSPESGVKLEMNENKPASQGRRESKSNQNQKSGSNPNYEHNVEVGVISESSQAALISDEEDNFPSLKQNILKPMMKRSKSEPDSSALMAQDPLTHSQMENEECDELEDSTGAVPSPMHPSANQRNTSMPDHIPPCENETHSLILLDTPGAQRHKINLSVPGFSKEEQPSPLCVPDVTVKPCSEEDCPETYAKAEGHSRPVYAISAFWDEMEKLTINDILQLRMNRGSSPRETGEATTPNVDESPTIHDPLVDTVEYNLSCSTPMDISDTADSDYFTQADESKPDQSSCEFSTSDFEEECWQFVGASRNPSPDPHRKNKHSRKDFAGTLALPRQLTKSKSMQNIQTLNRKNASLPALLGNDESSLFFSRCQSLAENTAFKLSDSLETQIPLSFLSSTDFLDYQISYPEVFEYFFTEDKVNSDSRHFTVYDPKDISVPPVFDYALCSCRDEMSFSPLHCNEEKPIPIFSCSHPTVRELTLPKVVEAAVGGSASWKSLLPIRKIHFHDKGSIWCRGSGDWVFPVDFEKIPKLEEQHFILETIQTTRHQGIFSTLKQSDMCLVCIAFASWVLRSSDPEAADAWKAALLANLSALSAIRYLRQYVKKRNPQPEF
uniref:Retinitis pigmentosa 1-like 1 protein-like n=1 Tax=Neolamprologus brichardi TaxID=32507 RepID=A0A3Q4HZQ4_NEOBR